MLASLEPAGGSDPDPRYRLALCARHGYSVSSRPLTLSAAYARQLPSTKTLLVGPPASTLVPLQRVQNAAAPLILGLSRRSHITPAVKQLHWLPIKFRITFKVATLMYNIFHQRSPPYLKDLVEFSPSAHQHQLRSSTTRSAVVRRTRTQFGRRAFSISGPDVWNSLPLTSDSLTHSLLSDAH